MGSVTSWEQDARCRVDPDLWFTFDAVLISAAKRECARCPVLGECAALALEVKPVAGVWAGLVWINGVPSQRLTEKAFEDGPRDVAGVGANREEGTW